MKIIKTVSLTGIVNHRNALYTIALIKRFNAYSIVWSVVLHKPGEPPNEELANRIAMGRIVSRLEGRGSTYLGKYKRILKFTGILTVPYESAHMFSRATLENMLIEVRRVKQQTLAKDLGLKYTSRVEPPQIVDTPPTIIGKELPTNS